MSMNVYTKMGYGSTLIALVLLAAILTLDVWLLGLFPSLQHGLPYLMLQAALVGLLLKIFQLLAGRDSKR